MGEYRKGTVELELSKKDFDRLTTEFPERIVFVNGHECYTVYDSIENGWMPCKFRMPEKDGIYLVSCKHKDYGNRAHTAVLKNGSWLGAEDFRKSIIAWMPLPEPYKGD